MNSSSNFYNAFNPTTYNAPFDAPGGVNQYYNIEQGKGSAGLANELAARNAGYSADVLGLQNQLGVDTRALNNNEGEKGTWGSSARDIRLNSLANSYNSQFGKLYATNQGLNTASLIGGEYNLGANGLSSLPTQASTPLSRYNVNLSTTGPTAGAYGASAVNAGQVKYNPFGAYGDIERQRQQALQYNKQFSGNMYNNQGLMK